MNTNFATKFNSIIDRILHVLDVGSKWAILLIVLGILLYCFGWALFVLGHVWIALWNCVPIVNILIIIVILIAIIYQCNKKYIS